MLTVQRLNKAFGAQVIFEDASLQLNTGDRFALMGPNGAGKSTLLRLVAGLDQPDGGTIVLPRHIRVGYLPQETVSLGQGTVLEETLCSARSPGEDLSAERRAAEAKKTLMGLGFKVGDFGRPVAALSGGWRMRVAIARLLVEAPDLLLLDEPTNHLDLESLLWLQEYLRRSRLTLLLISHDRAFVNAVAHGIVDTRERRLFRHTGSYEDFLAARRAEQDRLRADYKKQQAEIAAARDFINRFRAQASKAPQVQSRIKMLEKMVLIEIPPEEKTVSIQFPQPVKPGRRVLTLRGVRKSYGDVRVYDGLDFDLERGQRVAFVGPNGAGKSTLLKILAGVIPADGGERTLGLNVRAGYFSQHRWETLNADRTVLEEAQDTPRMNPDLLVRTVLGTFLLRGDAVFKKVAVLSGGEKSRLALSKLLLDPPNLLLLDEPTTHLDMPSVDALVDALRRFQGTLCFISHDLYFVNALASHVAHIEGGRVRLYTGNHDDFLRLHAPAPDVATAVHPGRSAVSGGAPDWVKTTPGDLRDLRASEKARAKERKKTNARLRALEEEKADLESQLSSVFIQSDYQKLMELDSRLKRCEADLALARAAWAALA